MWPAANGKMPNKYGVFQSDAVNETLVYPHSTRKAGRIYGGTFCEISLVALAGGGWCYGFHYSLRDGSSGAGPKANRVRQIFPTRRAALMNAYGHWQRTAARHRRRAQHVLEPSWRKDHDRDAREAQKVADWLLSTAASTRPGEQLGLLDSPNHYSTE